ncbi:MAG: hypothetical protein ACREMV_00380 [Gemmatimonadales bacterium]
MPHQWSPESEHDDELEALLRSDDESWRSDAHLADESWRGDMHLADWPEALAGPEYWMFKQLAAVLDTSITSGPHPWAPESEHDDELEALLRPQDQSRRDEAHLWPQGSAGPEYWMFKTLAEAA